MTPLQNLHLFVFVCVRLSHVFPSPLVWMVHQEFIFFYDCLSPNVHTTKVHWLQSHPQSNGLKGWGLREVISGLFKGQTDLPLPSAV